jgi:hypothetical protein
MENPVKFYNAILVSGALNSGMSAVTDLLKECDSFFNLDPQDESRDDGKGALKFYLIQHPDGILNLESILVDNWTDINPDYAIRRFRKLVEVLGRPHSRFFKLGGDFNNKLGSQFVKLSNEYIDNLIDFTHQGHNIFRRMEMNWANNLFQKIKNRVGISKGYENLTTHISCPGNSFIQITRNYFNDLFSHIAEGKNINNIVLLVPGAIAFHPQRCMNYFNSAKCILVDRDPRDMYLSALESTYLPREVDHFIKWYKLVRVQSQKHEKLEKNVLRIQYEDMVINYEHSISRIFSFLSIDQSCHSAPRKYFDPEISIKRIGKWKACDRKNEIEKISRHLQEYLYEGK